MDATTLPSFLQSTYVKNFIILFPLFLLGGLIAFLLNRAESLRSGAGLPTAPGYDPIPAIPATRNAEEGDEDENVDIDDLLAEAGGAVGNDEGVEDGDELGDLEDGNEAGAAGPAMGNGVARPPRANANKIVGKKKARSLEQRDRRRAYNEFIQSQAVERREREKAIEEEEKERLFEEKQRRALAEINIEKRKQREKAERKEAEEKNARYVASLRKVLSELKGSGRVSLRTLGHRVGKDEAWVKKTLADDRTQRGVKEVGGERVYTAVTASGWYIRVGKDEMTELAKLLEVNEKMSWTEIGEELEKRLKKL